MIRELGADPVDADIPGYEILSATGQGAMGRVFVARQTALGRLVAVKFLSIDSDADPAERLARFRREAAIMAALSHPNVVSIHDFGEVDEQPYLVMEYIEGGDLRKRMPEFRTMPPASVLATLGPIGEALDYLHSRGILHRDLKPENILMQGDVPKVADFGIAVERAGSGELTRSGQGLGTLGYVAPELQFRLPVDERADQYSLAAMAYEMLTGQRPLGLFKPPSRHNPEASEAVDRVVLRALEEDSKDRFGTVLGFLGALRTAIEAEAAEVVPSPPRPKSRVRWTVLVGAAVVAGLIGSAVWELFVQPQLDATPPELSAGSVIQLPRWPDPGSQEFEQLTRRRAEGIWRSQGSPKGPEGEAVSRPNWFRAKDEVKIEIAILAGRMWRSRVRPGLPFDSHEVKRVWAEAERGLLDHGMNTTARSGREGP